MTTNKPLKPLFESPMKFVLSFMAGLILVEYIKQSSSAIYNCKLNTWFLILVSGIWCFYIIYGTFNSLSLLEKTINKVTDDFAETSGWLFHYSMFFSGLLDFLSFIFIYDTINVLKQLNAETSDSTKFICQSDQVVFESSLRINLDIGIIALIWSIWILLSWSWREKDDVTDYIRLAFTSIVGVLCILIYTQKSFLWLTDSYIIGFLALLFTIIFILIEAIINCDFYDRVLDSLKE